MSGEYLSYVHTVGLTVANTWPTPTEYGRPSWVTAYDAGVIQTPLRLDSMNKLDGYEPYMIG